MTKDQIAAIEKIEAENDEIAADLLKEEAREVDHPWHKSFEWDDAIAGERYRTEQARAIIRRFRVVQTTEQHVYEAIAYVRNPDKPTHEQGYIATFKVPSGSELARRSIDREIQAVRSAVFRCRSLASRWGLLEETDQRLSELLARSKRATSKSKVV